MTPACHFDLTTMPGCWRIATTATSFVEQSEGRLGFRDKLASICNLVVPKLRDTMTPDTPHEIG